jgi:hypothetical protein
VFRDNVAEADWARQAAEDGNGNGSGRRLRLGS